MGIGLIVDSCCDLTPEMKEAMRARSVPLQVQVLDGGEYWDDGTVDIEALIADMAKSKHGAKSACPSVEAFAAHMREYDSCFVVTLSSKLSGSFNAACVARDIVQEESPEKRIHVIDSESASAGEVVLAMFIHEQIQSGKSDEEILPLVLEKVASMRTLFVLEDLGNFIKNGRISKVPGLIASVLSLCPVMGDDGHGDIKLVAKARGIANALGKLVEQVEALTAAHPVRSLRLTLAHCNCLKRAEALKQDLLNKCQAIKEIVVVPTGALSTMYANNGGVIVAFGV